MNFAALLRQELARRTRANPAYSMRSLAKSLEMSPSQLCEILGGRKNMSERTRARVAKKLGWSSRPTSRKSSEELRQLSWWHLAILELSTHEKVKSEGTQLARRLGISANAAKLAIEDLRACGLLEIKEGMLSAVPDRLFFGNGTPSETIRAFHKEALQLAARQMELTNYEEREFSTSVFALSPEKAQVLRRRIREVVEEFSDHASASSGDKEIFGFGIQLYKISNKQGEI